MVAKCGRAASAQSSTTTLPTCTQLDSPGFLCGKKEASKLFIGTYPGRSIKRVEKKGKETKNCGAGHVDFWRL